MANLEDALSIPELKLLADMTDPILNHARIDGPAQGCAIEQVHRRITTALKRARFHVATAEGAD